eukprot:jgi/Tetstr1/427981/TSEL_018054.t1
MCSSEPGVDLTECGAYLYSAPAGPLSGTFLGFDWFAFDIRAHDEVVCSFQSSLGMSCTAVSSRYQAYETTRAASSGSSPPPCGASCVAADARRATYSAPDNQATS